MPTTATIRYLDADLKTPADAHEALLDRAFFALSDPVRRAILSRLSEGASLVSELAAPFDISLQAISRHIQVLVRAGLVQQERTGRISTCSLDVGPMFAASVWVNRYSKYWQNQFDALAAGLARVDGAANKRTKKRAGQPRTKLSKRRTT